MNKPNDASASPRRTRLVLGLAALALVVLGVVAWLRSTPVADPDRGADGIRPDSAAIGAAGDDGGPGPSAGGARSTVSADPEPVPGAETHAPEVAQPEPADRSHVHGRVVDERGGPVSGAEVEALPSPAASSVASSSRATAKTDADGRFGIAVPDRTALLVRAGAPGFTTAWKSPVYGGERVDLVLRPAARLEVFVAEPDGKPASGAQVGVAALDAARRTAWSDERTTGVDGIARFEAVPRASLSVWATLAPHARAMRLVDTANVGEARVELALGRGLRITGRTLSAAGATPLAGVRVGCNALGFATTDGTGSYELGGIPASASSWGIGAVLAGFAPTYRYVRVDAATGDVVLDFSLTPAPALRGRVVDRAGRPLPGADVRATGRIPTAAFTGETLELEARSDAQGLFVLAPIHVTSIWSLACTGPAGERAARRIGPFPASASTIEIGDVVLDAPAGIVGRVERAALADASAARVALRAIQPAARPGSYVRGVAAAAPLDPWGAFRFDDLPPGRYWVELHATAATEARAPLAVVEVELAPGAREEVVLAPGRATIEGYVAGPDGRALRQSGIELVALDEKDRTVARGNVERDGAFSFAVPGTGEHTLLVRDPSLRFEEERVAQVQPGEDLRIQLRPRVGGRKIEGTLRSTDGKPVENLTVAFRHAGTFEVVGRVAIPQASGAFSMDGLENAPYYVEVTDFAGRYRPEPARLVGADEAWVEFQLEPRE